MATITEDYCSQEVYRLLREKGFDGEIHTTFDKEGYTQASITLQMAMKWLREVHKQPINLWYDGDIWSSEIYRAVEKDFCLVGHFQSYEEAVEAAIKYCLEHLI